MKDVAFVTYKNSSQISPSEDDNLLIDALNKEEIKVNLVFWDKHGVIWEQFSKVIIRSTWDYHYRVDEYKRWLTRLEQKGASLWNS